MLTKAQQSDLLNHLLGKPRSVTLMDSINVRKAFGPNAPYREGTADAVAVFVDIAGFSQRVKGFQPVQVRQFLSQFYTAAIKIIDEHQGLIDRIVGDGILAVFSPFLEAQIGDGDAAARKALRAAESIVEGLSGGECESKASIGCGTLLFCSTGLDGVYTDYTVLGNPLTHVYRMEERIGKNQVIAPVNSPVGKVIQGQINAPLARPIQGPAQWGVEVVSPTLRGAEELGPLFLQTYRR